MMKYPEKDGEKATILRLFNQKYPYEYLSDNKTEELCRQYEEFYKENFSDI